MPDDDTSKTDRIGYRFIPLAQAVGSDPAHRRAMGDAIWLYLHLVDRAGRDTGELVVKQATLGARLGMTDRTVRRHLDRLGDGGYIEHHSTGRATRIVLLPVPDPASRPDKDVRSERTELADRTPTSGQGCPTRPDRDVLPDRTELAGPIDKSLLGLDPFGPEGGGVNSESTADPEPAAPTPPPPPGEGGESGGDGFDGWWRCAQEAHAEIRGAPLTDRVPLPGHRRRIEAASRGRWGWQAVTVAWSLFLLDDPPGCGWLRGKPARTVPMFVRCLDDLLPVAVRELARRAERDARWDTPHWQRGELAQARRDPFASFRRGPSEQAVWDRARQALEAALLPDNFKTWIEPLQFGGINCTRAGLYTLSDYMTRCVQENFTDAVSAALSEAAGRDLTAVFAVQPMEGGG